MKNHVFHVLKIQQDGKFVINDSFQFFEGRMGDGTVDGKGCFSFLRSVRAAKILRKNPPNNQTTVKILRTNPPKKQTAVKIFRKLPTISQKK